MTADDGRRYRPLGLDDGALFAAAAAVPLLGLVLTFRVIEPRHRADVPAGAAPPDPLPPA